jgi:hypothetical protein
MYDERAKLVLVRGGRGMRGRSDDGQTDSERVRERKRERVGTVDRQRLGQMRRSDSMMINKANVQADSKKSQVEKMSRKGRDDVVTATAQE